MQGVDNITLSFHDFAGRVGLSKSCSIVMQDPLIYKGVVFNEMKGVYSQPDSMNGTITQQALFPSNSYAVDSGGNPAMIPDLTFPEFQVCCQTLSVTNLHTKLLFFSTKSQLSVVFVPIVKRTSRYHDA